MIAFGRIARLFISATFALGILFSIPLHAQQREIINQSFEMGTGQPSIGGNTITADSTIDGWISSSGNIEIWGDGAVGGTPSSDGNYFVELNPRVPIQLYQNICLVNGETLSWTFDHAARSGGPNPQTVVYEVTQLGSSSLVQTLDTSSLVPPSSPPATTWTTNSGSTTFNNPTGIYRLAFRSTNPGASGNLLDNVQITLVAGSEFTTASTSFAENSSGQLPQLRVSGTVLTSVTIPVTVTGGTATPGVDFASTGSATISIPAGVYDGTSSGSFFTVPYTIINDSDFEPDETIEFTIGSPSSSALALISASCVPAPLTVATHTIVNDDVMLIDAIDDTPPAVDGAAGATIPNVAANDTLGGVTNPTIGTDVTVNETGTAQDGTTTLGLDVTPAAGGITLAPATGEITVDPGTTAGTYVYTYEICEVLNPTNCDTAEVTVVVTPYDLISRIEEDLEVILEEDFANTLTMQSNQISGYSADALDRLRGRGDDQCLAAVNIEAENILFDVDQAIIKPESHRTLDTIAAILANCPGSAFEISSHTDSDASDAHNLDLSQRRVEAVLRALTAREVDITGYIARGYGENQPIASNATAAGKAHNRRVEFRALTEEDGYHGPCEDNFSLVRAFDVQANDDGANANGHFLRDEHDCITDRREVFEGTLSFSEANQGQTQTAINLSYRREHYRGRDSVFGYFVGMYASQSDVSRRATGEIRGLGINAGIYGANRLHDELFLDYYLGAATGRHEFDLAFDRSIGTITATGDYRYVAGFAGAALSGELEYGETTLTPRVGFDYVYTPGADVDVLAQIGALSEAGGLDLDAISGGRVFAEIRMDRLIWDNTANFWFNPRISCYQSLGSLDGVCGFGGSIGVESTDEDSDLTYSLGLNGEWGSDHFLSSVTARASRQIEHGILSGDAGLNADGNVTIGANFQMDF